MVRYPPHTINWLINGLKHQRASITIENMIQILVSYQRRNASETIKAGMIIRFGSIFSGRSKPCLLYTSDAADD